MPLLSACAAVSSWASSPGDRCRAVGSSASARGDRLARPTSPTAQPHGACAAAGSARSVAAGFQAEPSSPLAAPLGACRPVSSRSNRVAGREVRPLSPIIRERLARCALALSAPIGRRERSTVAGSIAPIPLASCVRLAGAATVRLDGCRRSVILAFVVMPGHQSIPGSEPEPLADWAVPSRRVYTMQHDVSVTRTLDGWPIPVTAIDLSLTADAWAWGGSMRPASDAALAALWADVNGDVVPVTVSIDGVSWLALAERPTREAAWGRRSYGVTLRGLSAELDAPYQDPTSGTAGLGTLAQLLEAHLPIGSGWTVQFDPSPDWTVPAGAWSWSNQTPIQALAELATGVGLIVVPATGSRVLRVRYAYPVAPWDYLTNLAAVSYPEASILSVSASTPTPTQANAVYVHGGEVGGILARCARLGSAGDRLAATVQHPAITDVAAARALGTAILAANHQPPSVRSVVLPFDGDQIPMPSVGDLVSVFTGGAETLATCRGVQVAVSTTDRGAVRVRQSIQFGADAGNRWSRLRSLLPSSPLLYAIITADHGDGTLSVSPLSGGTIRVRGAGTVGNAVWVRGGVVEGTAPVFSSAIQIEV